MGRHSGQGRTKSRSRYRASVGTKGTPWKIYILAATATKWNGLSSARLGSTWRWLDDMELRGDRVAWCDTEKTTNQFYPSFLFLFTNSNVYFLLMTTTETLRLKSRRSFFLAEPEQYKLTRVSESSNLLVCDASGLSSCKLSWFLIYFLLLSLVFASLPSLPRKAAGRMRFKVGILTGLIWKSSSLIHFHTITTWPIGTLWWKESELQPGFRMLAGLIRVGQQSQGGGGGSLTLSSTSGVEGVWLACSECDRPRGLFCHIEFFFFLKEPSLIQCSP